MKRSEVDLNKISPMMKHYLDIKKDYEDIILFYRLGDFYEMFFEDAELVSRTLELTLTGRNAGLEERVPMCGIPYHAKDVYLDKLVKKGFKVAICEQLEDPKDAKGIVKRDVTEVISMGMITNTGSLNEKENNFVGSIYYFNDVYLLTYIDITTGEVYSRLLNKDEDKLLSEIDFLSIKEIIVTSLIDKYVTDNLKDKYHLTITISDSVYTLNNYNFIYEEIEDMRVKIGINHLLHYLINNGKKDYIHLKKVKIIEANDYLEMNLNTKVNLELTENLRLKERTYSLLWLLDNCKTAMGSRTLKHYIEKPLVDINKIYQRYDIIDKLLNEFILADELREYLYKIYDIERLCGKIALDTANARDLVWLKNSVKVIPEINNILDKLNLPKLTPLEELYNLLESSVYEEAPITLKEGYLIKEGYNNDLDELKKLRNGGKDFIASFELEERERTGIKNLKVGFNKVFGYYIEVSKSQVKEVKEEYGYIRKQTLANCERYINELLKEKENIILTAEEKIINLEYQIFINIRNKCKEYINILQENSKLISFYDVMQSFAIVSEKYGFIRPVLNNNHIIDIKNLRHPVVERVMKEEYVDNDIYMDKDTNVILITGPNMAGKSTYLRQLGIAVIMAQIGCFIPASYANIPIFDKIFTRIGASDDLVSGRSTFMVEMLEASLAMKEATKNSLILFDELGRGTSTFDGMSIAGSILEYICNKVKCKTLFSTHYHELTELDKTMPSLKNYHVSAKEEDGEITFLHKVKEGSCPKSYGINVASLAKLPDEIITRAKELLDIYENKDNKKEVIVQTTLPLNFDNEEDEIITKLKELNINEMTPVNALNKLYELINEANKR